MNKDYEIGYGKPPKNSQFKKGKSGNAKGRKKGSKNLKTIIQNEAQEMITVKLAGKEKKVPKMQALVMATMAKGIKGNAKSADTTFELLEKYLPQPDPEIGEPIVLSDEEFKILRNHADFLEIVEEASDEQTNSE